MDAVVALLFSLLGLAFIGWYLRRVWRRMAQLPSSQDLLGNELSPATGEADGDSDQRVEQPLQSLWNPIGGAFRASIRVSERAVVLELRAQPCKGCESLGQLLLNDRPFRINWRRIEVRRGNISQRTVVYTWPTRSIRFPCTTLHELLTGSESAAHPYRHEASAAAMFERTGEATWKLEHNESEAGAVYNTSVDRHSTLTITLDLDKLTGTYEHRLEIDTSD